MNATRNRFVAPPSTPPPTRRSWPPPFRTCDWLLKGASQIKATFHEPSKAVAWLADQWDVIAPQMLHPYDHRTSRLMLASRDLDTGVDVQWGDWLNGGRFASLAVICCPNFHAPNYRCPAGLSQG